MRELARQALSSTERGYDLLAPKFDFTPFRTPDVAIEAAVEAGTSAASQRGDGLIDAALDVCCGTGAAFPFLRPRVATRLAGVDFSEGMLREAARAAERSQGGARVELVRADARSLPYAGEFDLVTSFGAFGHFVGDDEDLLIAGVARALKPGGAFAFVTADMPAKTTRAYWLARAFNAAMHARNAIVKPEFVMFYLTFTWPEVAHRLERHGLVAGAIRKPLPPPFERLIVVVARKT